MAARYHITKAGNPAPCYAQRNCPIGGEHFPTQGEARRHYEKIQTGEILPSFTKISEISQRDLSKLGKFTSDREIIDQILKEGGDAALKSLGHNPNVTETDLVKALEKTDSEAVKKSLKANQEFPVRFLSGEDFTNKILNAKTSNEIAKMLESDDISDEHFIAVNNRQSALSRFNNTGMLRNPNNKLSQELLIREGESNWLSLGPILQSGRFPSEKISTLSEKAAYWGNVSHLEDLKYLEGYADWVVRNQSSRNASSIAREIAVNKNSSASALDKIAKTGLADLEVFEHANISLDTRSKLLRKNPKLWSKERLNQLDAQLGGKDAAKKELILSSQSVNLGRSYNASRVKIDMAKAKEFGLDREDLLVMLKGDQFNAGVTFNEETGEFEGRIDSGD